MAHVHVCLGRSRLNEDQTLHNGNHFRGLSYSCMQRICPFLAFSGQHDEKPAMISAAFVCLFVTASFNMQLAKSAAKQRGICITTLTALELVDQFIGKQASEMHRPVRSSVSNAATIYLIFLHN